MAYKYKVGDHVKVRVVTNIWPEVESVKVEAEIKAQLNDFHGDPEYSGLVLDFPGELVNNFIFWESDIVETMEVIA